MADERKLVSVVEQQTQLLEGVLQGVKSKFKELDKATGAMQDFVESGISQLGKAIGIYSSLFTSLHIASRSDLEALFKQHYRHQSVQDAVSALEELETEWDHFLEDLEKQTSVTDEARTHLTVGSPGPCDLTVQNARTGLASTLSSYLAGSHSLILILLRHFS